MKRKSIFIVILSFVAIGFGSVLFDFFDRGNQTELVETLSIVFPKSEVKSAKIYKNQIFIGRIFAKKLSENHKNELIDFFNDSYNYDCSETTWERSESDYILRFYNENDTEIIKIWIDLEAGITFAFPVNSNMKYGILTQKGLQKLQIILKDYR